MQWKEMLALKWKKNSWTAEIREIFKISKVGSIAGCMVMDGKIARNLKSNYWDGVVVHTGELFTETFQRWCERSS
jgi:translation initiation factor IF-2